MGDADFKNSDFQVQKAPEGTTCRAVIGMAAALAGGNARIDENDLLRIVTFDKEDNVVLMEEIPWPDVSGQSILDTEDEERGCGRACKEAWNHKSNSEHGQGCRS